MLKIKFWQPQLPFFYRKKDCLISNIYTFICSSKLWTITRPPPSPSIHIAFHSE